MNNRGFIGTIVLIIAGLAALKYFFDWSIFDALASEEGKGTIDYIRDVLNAVWSYIRYPVIFAWDEVVWPLLEFALDSLRAMIEQGRAASQ